MEQDVKVGAAGSVSITESVSGEVLKGSLPIGPAKISLEIEIDNKGLIDLAAARVPGGLAHEAIIALEKALFPVASA